MSAIGYFHCSKCLGSFSPEHKHCPNCDALNFELLEAVNGLREDLTRRAALAEKVSGVPGVVLEAAEQTQRYIAQQQIQISFEQECMANFVLGLRGGVPCEWTGDADGVWHTGCGNAFFFDDGGGPVEHKQAFCGYCGGTLKEGLREESDGP